MVRLAILAILGSVISQIAVCAPLPMLKAGNLISARAFTELPYAQFQISDGTAGKAEDEANAVFLTPFDGVDLATVSAADLKAVQNMREAAEAAETDQFNPAIAAATGTAKVTLQNGKIKNKVLKLTGEILALQIKMAQQAAKGSDTTSTQAKITAEQTKLTNNIALDVKAAGQASKGVV